MAKQPKNNEDDIFDADSKLKLDQAYEAIDRPDRFAKIFCKVAEDQVMVQKTINKLIQKALAQDVDSRSALKGIVRQVLKEDWRSFVRSTGGKLAILLWTLAVLFLGAWADKFF